MSRSSNKNHKRETIICRCNQVSRDKIEAAILRGCKTMNQIFDATRAGVGACGGSCRPKIHQIYNELMNTQKKSNPDSNDN